MMTPTTIANPPRTNMTQGVPPVAGKSPCGTMGEPGSKDSGGSGGVSGVGDEVPGCDDEVTVGCVLVGVNVVDGSLEVVEVVSTDELVSGTLDVDDCSGVVVVDDDGLVEDVVVLSGSVVVLVEVDVVVSGWVVDVVVDEVVDVVVELVVVELVVVDDPPPAQIS